MERTFDYRIINKMAPWDPVISSKIIYLVDENAGVWVFHEHKDGMISHVEMKENCRGADAVEQCKKAIEWIFENTDTKVIYAEIDNDNKPACHNAVRCGFTFIKEEDEVRFYEVRR